MTAPQGAIHVARSRCLVPFLVLLFTQSVSSAVDLVEPYVTYNTLPSWRHLSSTFGFSAHVVRHVL
jgi:hypothetical protein